MHARLFPIFHCAAAMIALALAGCTHEVVLPGGAEMISSGQGILRFAPEDNGTVYVMDASAKHGIFSTHIWRGETVLIDPAQNLIEIRGEASDHKIKLDPEHVYRIYFDRDS